MTFRFFNVSIKVSYLLIVMLTFFSLFDKTYLSFFAFLSAVIHEMGHIISAKILKVDIKRIEFMPFGIKMVLKNSIELIPLFKKIVILFAGSFVNLTFCVLILFFFPEYRSIAVINLIIGFFNLLPVNTLDGGRILYQFLSLFLPLNIAEKICLCVSVVMAIFFLLLGVILLLKSGYNFSLIITAVYLLMLIVVNQKMLN